MKTWKIPLGSDEINSLIRDIEDYSNQLTKKLYILIERLFKEGIVTIDNNVIPHEDITTDVKAYFEIKYSKHNTVEGILIAEGEELLFIEFGTGITYNGTAGSSPHPDGVKLGYTIGDYGYKLGRLKDGWHYKDKQGEEHHTYGIKAQMPVYKANLQIIMTFMKVVKEVFG